MNQDSILKQVTVDCFLIPAQVVQDPKVIAHCLDPYYKHPNGCPNWNHKNGCPPHTKLFLIQYTPLVYLAMARLDFAAYLKLKAQKHPGWTERALKNPRHWQGFLRARLKEYLDKYGIPSGYQLVTNPEAMGINLFETCKSIGITLERNPQKYVYQIYLLAKLAV